MKVLIAVSDVCVLVGGRRGTFSRSDCCVHFASRSSPRTIHTNRVVSRARSRRRMPRFEDCRLQGVSDLRYSLQPRPCESEDKCVHLRPAPPCLLCVSSCTGQGRCTPRPFPRARSIFAASSAPRAIEQ
ncbi:unnamed protein product, partial [Scytosiphon promiscuus]